MSRIVSKLLMLMMLMGSLQVFAGNKNPDETVLINQTSVQDAGGFPFKITAPGSYKLIGNLVVPANTTGILVQSNDVTLDLNGFSITGGIVCDNGGTIARHPRPAIPAVLKQSWDLWVGRPPTSSASPSKMVTCADSRMEF